MSKWCSAPDGIHGAGNPPRFVADPDSVRRVINTFLDQAADTRRYQAPVLSTESLELSTRDLYETHMESLAEIDWEEWTPTDRATLLFIIERERILLIEKKRGLGAGKVNGPGGRIDPGERPIDAAVRELREELGVGARGVVEHGELSFHFLDGYMLHCHVFRADACEGDPIETDEATPLWTPVDAIPFHRMWADDALWLPRLIAGERFRGRFIFDGDRMVDHELVALI